MDNRESFHQGETLALIGRYATPLALILILTGLIFSPLSHLPRRIVAVLFISSAFLNFSFVPLVSRLPEGTRSLLAKSRASINLWINIVLVYLLGTAWPPIWLLLSISSVATAIYGKRERALLTAVFLTVVLGIVNALHSLNTPYNWALVAAKGSFIILTSLMINVLAHPKKSGD
jgi:membrane-associated HD superfamily phosphohydrolase